jgi:hypothetical protein
MDKAETLVSVSTFIETGLFYIIITISGHIKYLEVDGKTDIKTDLQENIV